jgi:hypothetical protein
MITFLPDDYTPPPSRGGLRYAVAGGLLALAAAAAMFTYFQVDVPPLSERARSPSFTAAAHASPLPESSAWVPFHEQYGVRALEASEHIEAF